MPCSLIVVFSMAAQVNYELDYQRLNSSTNSQSALNPVYAHAQVYDVQVLNVYGRRELKFLCIWQVLGSDPNNNKLGHGGNQYKPPRGNAYEKV